MAVGILGIVLALWTTRLNSIHDQVNFIRTQGFLSHEKNLSGSVHLGICGERVVKFPQAVLRRDRQ